MKTNESGGSSEEKNLYIIQKYTLFQGIHRFKAYKCWSCKGTFINYESNWNSL